MKFDIANLYIKVPSRSNKLFVCPLDVFKVLYCHQSVPCALGGSNRLFLCPLDVLNVMLPG